MVRTSWCSTLSQNCSGLWHQSENMSAEPEYLTQNCTVPSSPTGKSCTHSADKEQFFFLFVVSQQKYFGSSSIYIHAGHSVGPLWLQLRILLSRNIHYLLSSLQHQNCSPSGPNTVFLCYARPFTLACWLLLIAAVVLYCLSKRSNSL